MQTTLRIDDDLYREAKAEAARAGVSMTRFLEEGLRLRLERRPASSPTSHFFRTYGGGKADTRTWEEIRAVAEAEQEAADVAKLGLEARPS